jgi:hypothetical protein
MALATQNSNLAWQKVKIALDQFAAPNSTREALKALKARLALTGGNPDLQFVPFTAAQAAAAGGTDLIGAAAKVYALYAQNKRAAAGTQSFFDVHGAASDASAATVELSAAFQAITTKQTALVIRDEGLALATGVTVTAVTAPGGTTDSDAADSPDGFLIVGAA